MIPYRLPCFDPSSQRCKSHSTFRCMACRAREVRDEETGATELEPRMAKSPELRGRSPLRGSLNVLLVRDQEKKAGRMPIRFLFAD